MASLQNQSWYLFAIGDYCSSASISATVNIITHMAFSQIKYQWLQNTCFKPPCGCCSLLPDFLSIKRNQQRLWWFLITEFLYSWDYVLCNLHILQVISFKQAKLLWKSHWTYHRWCCTLRTISICIITYFPVPKRWGWIPIPAASRIILWKTIQC